MTDTTARDLQIVAARLAGESLRSVAQRFGISHVRVLQIERKSREKREEAK